MKNQAVPCEPSMEGNLCRAQSPESPVPVLSDRKSYKFPCVPRPPVTVLSLSLSSRLCSMPLYSFTVAVPCHRPYSLSLNSFSSWCRRVVQAAWPTSTESNSSARASWNTREPGSPAWRGRRTSACRSSGACAGSDAAVTSPVTRHTLCHATSLCHGVRSGHVSVSGLEARPSWAVSRGDVAGQPLCPGVLR